MMRGKPRHACAHDIRPLVVDEPCILRRFAKIGQQPRETCRVRFLGAKFKRAIALGKNFRSLGE